MENALVHTGRGNNFMSGIPTAQQLRELTNGTA
jgi:hypothetical protein